MSAIDFVIIALIAVAFGAVVVRVRKKGTCGDCAQAGSCGGSCAGCSTFKRATCPACEGVEQTVKKLGRGIERP